MQASDHPGCSGDEKTNWADGSAENAASKASLYVNAGKKSAYCEEDESEADPSTFGRFLDNAGKRKNHGRNLGEAGRKSKKIFPQAKDLLT